MKKQNIDGSGEWISHTSWWRFRNRLRADLNGKFSDARKNFTTKMQFAPRNERGARFGRKASNKIVFGF